MDFKYVIDPFLTLFLYLGETILAGGRDGSRDELSVMILYIGCPCLLPFYTCRPMAMFSKHGLRASSKGYGVA